MRARWAGSSPRRPGWVQYTTAVQGGQARERNDGAYISLTLCSIDPPQVAQTTPPF
jgi:hypothetical protein